MNSGLHFGIKKSIPHYLGICFGFPAMVLMVALGLGTIFVEYSWIKSILKVLGSAYMLYLAFLILRSNAKSSLGYTMKPLNFIQAVLFQWINPKAWLMAIGAISIFSITNDYFYNAFTISMVFLIMCLPCIGIWLLFGKYLQTILKKDSHRLWFNILMAMCLVASIVMIFVD